MLTEVCVLGRKVHIKQVSKNDLKEMADDEVLGYFDPSEDTIYMSKSLSSDVFQRVLLHELLHATLNISGLSEIVSSEQEEALATVMESWVQLFQQKKLIEELSL